MPHWALTVALVLLVGIPAAMFVLAIGASIATGLIGLVGSCVVSIRHRRRETWMPPWADELESMIDDI